MYAKEFHTILSEPYIKIPEFESFKGHRVRVIILDLDKDLSQDSDRKEDFIEFLTKNPIDLSSDLKFLSREEAHER